MHYVLAHSKWPERTSNIQTQAEDLPAVTGFKLTIKLG
tara:strand:+ start:178 stop:291 length:114 start_codon:yes stop_codon:yes gene_type:complete